MSTTTLPPLYQPLDTSRRQIRLMMLTSRPLDEDIRCSMQIFDLDSMPKFIALSYAWGADENLQTIIVNGRECRIRPGLLEFLQVFKTWDDWRPVWVDQICIDQSNVLEKNHQVGIMEHIYRGAIETFCWLGPDPSNGQIFPAARKLIAYAKANSDDSGQFDPTDCEDAAVPSSEEISKFEQLAHLNYWKRHWIIQEIYLSRNAILVLGPQTMRFSDLTLLASSSDIEVLIDQTSMLVLMLKLNVAGKTPDLLLFFSASIAQDSVCSDLRDEVYGIQSLMPAEWRIEVNYDRSTLEVWQDVVHHWIRWYDSGELADACLWLAVGMNLSLDEVSAALEEELEICGDDEIQAQEWLTHLSKYIRMGLSRT